MAVIEARMPDGRLAELAEVNLTKSGLLIMITDNEGSQVLIHRYAWNALVKEVDKLLGNNACNGLVWPEKRR